VKVPFEACAQYLFEIEICQPGLTTRMSLSQPSRPRLSSPSVRLNLVEIIDVAAVIEFFDEMMKRLSTRSARLALFALGFSSDNKSRNRAAKAASRSIPTVHSFFS
jgi:hypothetical protein